MSFKNNNNNKIFTEILLKILEQCLILWHIQRLFNAVNSCTHLLAKLSNWSFKNLGLPNVVCSLKTCPSNSTLIERMSMKLKKITVIIENYSWCLYNKRIFHIERHRVLLHIIKCIWHDIKVVTNVNKLTLELHFQRVGQMFFEETCSLVFSGTLQIFPNYIQHRSSLQYFVSIFLRVSKLLMGIFF